MQSVYLVLRKLCHVLSYIVICCPCHTTPGRSEDKSSFTLDCCRFAYCLRHCDYSLYCFIDLYRNPIGLCATKATLCHTCLIGIAVQVCHVPKPNRSGAVKRLVY